MPDNRWSQPQQVDPVDARMGASTTHELIPAWEDIPEAFKDDGHPWVSLMHRWFAVGIPGSVMNAREGIIRRAALAHLSAVMRSFAPRHEHKIAGCAYLCSLWFLDPVTSDG